MAELYRCPSAVDDVREGVIIRAGFALQSICMGCTIYCLLYANIYGKTHLLRDCTESTCLAESRPPSSPLSPVSELVLLPRPCLPRMEVFDGGVFTDTRAG